MMTLRNLAGLGGPSSTEKKDLELANPERVLTLMVEGTARSVPEFPGEAYKQFRDNVAKFALLLNDRLPDEEKLAHVRSVLNEFDAYRKAVETELRDRKNEWRALVSFLFNDLAQSLGIDSSAPDPAQLLRSLASVESAQSIRDCCDRLRLFLHPAGPDSMLVEASQFHKADLSTANDNAAGLRGGGSAVERVQRIMQSGGKGFVVLFRLSCLAMINQRFGLEAVQDCLMAVASFLTESLHSDDTIYHWSDSSLLAILQGRANEQILTAELDRIAMKNREITISIGGRATMLRIPITFDITPIECLRRPEDLYKIALLTNSGRAR